MAPNSELSSILCSLFLHCGSPDTCFLLNTKEVSAFTELICWLQFFFLSIILDASDFFLVCFYRFSVTWIYFLPIHYSVTWRTTLAGCCMCQWETFTRKSEDREKPRSFLVLSMPWVVSLAAVGIFPQCQLSHLAVLPSTRCPSSSITSSVCRLRGPSSRLCR